MHTEVPRLVEIAGETSILYKDRNLYGSGSPIAGARRRAEGIPLQENTFYLLPSPLLWYGVPELLDRLPASSVIISLEVNPSLAEISLKNIPSALTYNSSLRYLHINVEEGIYALYGQLGPHRFRRVKLLTLNAGYRLHHNLYSRVYSLMEEEIQQFWHNKYTLMYMLPLWIKNIFHNLSHLCIHDPDSPVVLGFPQVRKPIIVTGAGPSLDANIPFLNDNRERFFLLAADTAYTPLMKCGLIPDAVVVQEAQFFNLYDFISFPGIQALIFADITSYPGVLRTGKSPIHLFATQFQKTGLLSRLQNAGLIPSFRRPMGSVGSTAVDIALSLTDFPVLFTGIDFSFPVGRTHTKGSPSHLKILQSTHRYSPVINISPYTAAGIHSVSSEDSGLLTTFTLERYADNFRRYFSGNSRLFQLTPEGLPLGVQLIENGEAFSILAGQTPEMRNRDDSPGTDFSSNPISSPMRSEPSMSFLETELELLKRIYILGRDFLYAKLCEKDQEELLSQLNCCEYLFIAFPDTGYKLNELDPCLIKRILVSAGHYIDILERLIVTSEN